MAHFELIAASALNGCIGDKGRLPWDIKEDMRRFKAITTNTHSPCDKNIVIMGKNTYLSIPERHRPLSDRINIVVTSCPDAVRASDSGERKLTFASSFEDALIKASEIVNGGSIYVIGGVSLYREGILDKRCDRVYLTVVKKVVYGDAIVGEFKKLISGKLQDRYTLVRCRESPLNIEYRIYESKTLQHRH